NDLTTTGLTAYGVQLNFSGYTNLVTVGDKTDISPSVPFNPTFPLNLVGSGFARSDSIVLSSSPPAMADANGRVLLGTFRFTGLAPGLAFMVSSDAHTNGAADTLLASRVVIDSQIADRSALINVLSPGLAGDYNRDGVVDAGDYITWRRGMGTTF